MQKLISSEIVVAYFHCPRKAFLLMSGERGVDVEYVNILNRKIFLQKSKYVNDITPTRSDIQVDKLSDLKKHGNTFVNIDLKSEHFEARCDILTRNYKVTPQKKTSFEPTIFIGTHNVGKEHKLELAFIGYVLGKIEGQIPEKGTIISADGKSHGLKQKPLLKSLQKIVSPLQDWLSFSTSQPPPIILNKHCMYCQFQKSCKLQAEETDNLSQRSGMNVKVIQKYEKKGIFTIKQLSYLFKPRRLKKQARNHQKCPGQADVVHCRNAQIQWEPEKMKAKLCSSAANFLFNVLLTSTRNHQKTHKPELRALAIRTGKIYIQELPSFSRQSVELFVDIEGIPDQNLYYLFGLLVCDESNSAYHPFWADTNSDETHAWKNFIDEIKKYPNAPIYHYGNYDLRAMIALSKRYGSDINDIKGRLVNINSQIYGKIYFPLNSNGLKEIGGFIGASWALSNSTGIQSLVWRYKWEMSQDTQYKNYLLTYNQDDCSALKLLTDHLSKIKDTANTWSDVDFISTPKRDETDSGKQIHDYFETILKSAHANYDQKKIKFRHEVGKDEKVVDKPKSGHKLGYQGQRKVKPKATKTIQISSEGQVCPKDGTQLQPRKQKSKRLVSKRLVIDLVLTRGGVKKTITEYIGEHGYRRKCLKSHAPAEIRAYGANQLYEHGFQAWIIYQRVALHMTYASILEVVAEQFKEDGFQNNIGQFIKNISQYYKSTEMLALQRRFTLLRRFDYYYDVLRRGTFFERC